MSERTFQKKRSAALMLTTSILLYGCSSPQTSRSTETHQQPVKAPIATSAATVKGELPRCFNKSLTGLKQDSTTRPEQTLSLPYDTTNQTISSDPGFPSHRVQDKVFGAIVQVIRPDKPQGGTAYNAQGSGFIIKSHGNEFVITAAHVVMPAKIKQLTVYDTNGNQSGVASGCYIYDDPGVMRTPTLESNQEVGADLAILKLDSHLGTTALSFSKNDIARGDWATFINYQGHNAPANLDKRTPADPAEYNGVVAKTDGHTRLITGVEPWIKPGPLTSSQAIPGSSGGVVVDSAGGIVGMSYAGGDPTQPLSGDELQQIYGFEFPNANLAPSGQFAPTVAVLINDNTIEHALTSKKLS